MKKNKLIILGVGLVVLLAIVFLVVQNRKIFEEKGENIKKKAIVNHQSILASDDNAFGEIDFNQNETNKAGMGTKMSVDGRGGESLIKNGKEEVSAIYPPYPTQNIRYVYQGGDFEIKTGEVSVLKREKGFGKIADFEKMLSGFDLDLTDLSSFDSVRISNLNFTEDKLFGLSVNLNFDEGSLSIFENYQRWSFDCQVNGQCEEQKPLKVSDVPTDDELIRLADEFLVNHGIDLSYYEKGEVQNQWKNQPPLELRPMVENQKTDSVSNVYVPETVSIIYQLTIDGKKVYEVYGEKNGITVNVNLRHKKISSVYGINKQSYQSSGYPAEESKEEILKVAQKGGWDGYSRSAESIIDEEGKYPFEEDQTKYQTVHLDTPEFGYVKYLNYRNGENVELYVPAYIFSVKETENQKDFYFKKKVVVPAVRKSGN